MPAFLTIPLGTSKTLRQKLQEQSYGLWKKKIMMKGATALNNSIRSSFEISVRNNPTRKGPRYWGKASRTNPRAMIKEQIMGPSDFLKYASIQSYSTGKVGCPSPNRWPISEKLKLSRLLEAGSGQIAILCLHIGTTP
jgi:hypothetical protein